MFNKNSFLVLSISALAIFGISTGFSYSVDCADVAATACDVLESTGQCMTADEYNEAYTTFFNKCEELYNY